jgi:RimJ/RimL family protein N-acetyltransferase
MTPEPQLPSPQFFADWTSHAPTRVGVEICIRPLRADDREREVDFILSLSEQTRYMRMFAPLKFLRPHLLNLLMDVDYSERMAFVATIERDGGERFLGLARYAATDERGVVELGITVTDDWQRRGIARLLMAELMRFAAWRGMRKMVGSVLPENHPMLALARRLGFTVSYDPAARLMQISCALGDPSHDVPVAVNQRPVQQVSEQV